MPNRVSHTFYYLNFKKLLRESKAQKENPGNNGAPNVSNIGIEALEEGLSELLE